MSTLNTVGISASIGAGSLIINDYRLEISDIEGGHRLTVTRGGEVQTMDVMDGGGTSGTVDHRELTNRDAENQHPISAITGLEEALEQPTSDDALEILYDTGIIDPVTDSDGAVLTDADGSIFTL